LLLGLFSLEFSLFAALLLNFPSDLSFFFDESLQLILLLDFLQFADAEPEEAFLNFFLPL